MDKVELSESAAVIFVPDNAFQLTIIADVLVEDGTIVKVERTLSREEIKEAIRECATYHLE
jgi:hypothetical protein